MAGESRQDPLEAVEARWRGLVEAVAGGMRAWRVAHPRATFREIEAALDERLDRARARLLEDAAQASPLTDLRQVPPAERPRCAACGATLQARGPQTRAVTVRGDQQVRLRRSYAACPSCGAGVFPPG